MKKIIGIILILFALVIFSIMVLTNLLKNYQYSFVLKEFTPFFVILGIILIKKTKK